MEKLNLQSFHEIVFCDFEYSNAQNQFPDVQCMVAHELRSGRVIRLGKEELSQYREPPFPIYDTSLFVAYYSSAEFRCFNALGWSKPKKVVDLYAEFRNLTNGLAPREGAGLLGALAHFNLPSISQEIKDEIREIILAQRPLTPSEQTEILDYCESDVQALRLLLPKLEPFLTDHSLIRGRYFEALADIECRGIPIDIETLNELRDYGDDIKLDIVRELDSLSFFHGPMFKQDRFIEWLARTGRAWPTLHSGSLDLRHETFRDMAHLYPELQSIHQCRRSLSQLRLEKLTIGSDGRNREMLSAFGAITSRNQPSTSKFIYGPASWVRNLINPAPGMALAYIDWSAQEFASAAYLSGDCNMIAAYESGDPYLFFGKRAGVIPQHATKSSHKTVRDLFKVVSLATQYGMGPFTLAPRIGRAVEEAKELLAMHRKVYPRFWEWNDAIVNTAYLRQEIQTGLGWRLNVTSETKERTLRNFPMQGNGAEMLRLACIMAYENGVRICAPVHDALLIEAPADEIEDMAVYTQECMERASEIVLQGPSLRTETRIVAHPDRLGEERGEEMWLTIQKHLRERRSYNFQTTSPVNAESPA